MIEHERDLFVHTLRDLYHIERDLEDLQSALAGEATREELEEFYMAHSERTTEQLDRLETIFEAIDTEVEPGAAESAALLGLQSDREQRVADIQDPILADIVEMELGRAIERLEVTKIETLLTLADRMNLPPEVVDALERTRTEAEGGLERLQELPQ